MEDILIKTFCNVDDFCQFFLNYQTETSLSLSSAKKPTRIPRLSLSEVMTIIIHFHQSGYACFKHYYTFYVQPYLKKYFPKLCSYNRFVQLMQTAIIPLIVYTHYLKGEPTDIQFIDSTKLTVCHNLRIASHKVFKGLAQRGKSSTGWFFGFKLHLIINEKGEILSFKLTTGSVDDRNVLGQLTKGLKGKLYGDRGYISQKWFEELLSKGLSLVTKLKKNMKNKLMDINDKVLLFKRSVIGSVYNNLKSGSRLEHHRHRSPQNFAINVLASLIAYQESPNKPSINLTKSERKSMQKLALSEQNQLLIAS